MVSFLVAHSGPAGLAGLLCAQHSFVGWGLCTRPAHGKRPLRV